jgi:pimeloyl-ACP methyl ester carboxylesterase
MNPESTIIDANGARLTVEVQGQGEPLVFIHAGVCDSRMWDAQIAHFAPAYRVVRYDMRGYGQSPPVDGEFSHHRDLMAVLDHLGIDSAHLVGCSMGGEAALELALLAPERTRSLVMVCSLPHGYEFTGGPPPIWDEIVAAYNAGDDETVSRLDVELWLAGRGRTLDDIEPAIVEKALTMDRIALANERRGLGQRVHLDPPAIGRLEELAMPLLAITGAHDEPEIDSGWDKLMARVADGRKVPMEGVAHLPAMERPDEFNRILEDFLAATASG